MKVSKKMSTLIFLWVLTVMVSVVVASLLTATYYDSYTINVFATIILPAIVSAVSTAVPVYIGVVIGVPKEFDNAIDKIEEKMQKSPTAKRAMKLFEMSDKLFGDEQAVAQITAFFKEARELVGSPEAKNFFKNATKALNEFTKTSADKEEDLIQLPKKPT